MGRNTRYHDLWAGITLILLAAFGLFLLLTINTSLFWQQMLYVGIGVVLFFLISHIDGVVYAWFAPFGYIFSLFFLASSYFGPAIRGARRWILIAGQQFQPSELAKPVMLLTFAFFITKFPPKKMPAIILNTILFLIPFILIFKQPDLGTSIVYFVMWISMMIMGGLPIGLIIGGIATFVAGLPLLWTVLAPYQKSRIETFLNPMLDPRGAGYNALQAMIAVGSGQWFGRGLGLGTQSHLRFLPEYFTDFMFATLVEELGVIGGLMLLSLYAFLLWRILQPLFHKDITGRFPMIYAIGLFGMVLTQILVNSGMNMGVFPVTGITLPLVSYGGSSLLSIAVSFGILWAIAFEP